MSHCLVCDWMMCSRDEGARARLILERLGLGKSWFDASEQVAVELRDPPAVLTQFPDIQWAIGGVSEFGLVLWACYSGQDERHEAGGRVDGMIFVPFSNVICFHDFTWQLLLNIESAHAKKQPRERDVWRDFPDATGRPSNRGANGERRAKGDATGDGS